MEEERDNGSKASSRGEGDSAERWAGTPQELNLSSAYATLLDQYREALARIHVLEMQNQNLANMVKLSPPPILSQDLRASTGALEAAELATRIEAVDRLLAKTAADGSETQGSKGGSRDEVAQLRIQVQSLLGQLSRLNGQHDKTKGLRPQGDSRHGWRVWSYRRRSWLNRILKR